MDRTDRAGAVSVLAALLLALPGSAQYTISTVAGGGPANGTAATRVGLAPQGVAIDGSGNVYLPSYYDCRVYRVDVTGALTIAAGNGACGYSGDNGSAANAALDYPRGVALDSAGNLYIADSGNNRVRKVTGGVITTVAGNGTAGFSGDNGAATGARLNSPAGVALDSSGNLYIADSNNQRIRRVSAGTIATVAGTGTAGFSGDNGSATSAQLNSPTGVAVDSSGGLYIADSSNHRVRKVVSGAISTVAGNGTAGFSGDNGQATSAQLFLPFGVAVDSTGNLYIADSGNRRVRRVAGGVISTVAGNGSYGSSGDGGSATAAQLSNVYGVAAGTSSDFFIADFSNNRIRKVSDGVITTLAGNGFAGFSGDSGGATSAQVSYPAGVAVDGAGHLFIADFFNSRIRRVSAGVITTVAGNGTAGFSGDNGPATSAQLSTPFGVAADSSGNLFIADLTNQRIRKVSGGVITTVAGNGTVGFSGDHGSATSAQLNSPAGVAVDGAGNLYIADTGNNRVRKVSGGVISTVAGNGIQGYSGEGQATDVELNSPEGVAVDSTGNLYIADSGNNRIRKVSGGVISTIAGNGNPGYSGDGGPATSAQLGGPKDVALDGAGNLYIADSNIVRKVSGGVITTVAGSGGYGYSGDNGAAVNGRLASPSGVALDSSGNVFVADYYNNRVRQLTPASTTITTLSPSSASAGTPDLTLTVNGTNFVNGDTVLWNGAALGTKFVSATQLSATVPASLLFVTGTAMVSVAVFAGTATSTLTFSITPAAVTCAYTLAAASANVVSTAFSDSVGLTANCAYSAVSTAPWISITSGATGAGSGSIGYSVANNAGGPRTGTFSVLDANGLEAAIFTIHQAASPCTSLAVDPAVATFVAAGGSGSGTFNTPGCAWSATVSANASWVTLPANSGDTSSPLAFTVAQNSGSSSRSATITVNGNLTVGITQTGVTCTYSIATAGQTASSTSQSFLSPGGGGNITITAPQGCPWTVSSNAAWLTLSSGDSGSGTATIGYGAAPNSETSGRTAILTIAGLAYVINEAEGASSYSATVNATAPLVRAEGEAELTGDLVVGISGQTNAAVTGDVVVAYNTTISNHSLSSDASGQTTDALLLINEPQTPTLGTNAFRGVVAGPNTIKFPGVPLVAAAGSFSATLRITNVRVNASALGASGTVQATVSFVAPAPFSFTGDAQQVVGFVQKGSYFAQGSGSAGPSGYAMVPLTFTEGFASAYRPKLATGQNPSQAGTVYNSESGYVNTAKFGNETGLAANGTRLVARFANVPANVTVYAPLTAATGNAALVSADTDGVGGFQVSPSAATIIGGAAYLPVALTNGAGTATWEITASNPAVVEALTFNLLASANPGTIAGGLGPQVAVTAPSLTAPTPRFLPPSPPPPAKLSILPQASTGGTASAAIIRLTNVKIRPAVGTQAATVGGTITVTEVLTNTGPTASNVLVGGTLPPTALITGCSSDGGSCQFQNNTVGVSYPSLTTGQSKTIVVTATVQGVPVGSYLVYSANVVSDQGNSNFQTGAYAANFLVSPLPVLSVTMTHVGNFVQGQQNDTYTVLVTNTGGSPTDGTTVKMFDVLPSGLTLVSMAGTGWSCSATQCVRGDVLNGGASYPPVTVTVNVAVNAPASVSNVVEVNGGGIAALQTAIDVTTILPLPAVPVLVYPPNNQSGVPLNPTLTWNAASGATSYDVYFGTSQTPPMVGNTKTITFAEGPLQPSTLYYWRICAKNSAGPACSDTWKFTTASATLNLSPTQVNFGVVGTAVTAAQTVRVLADPGLAWSVASTAGYLAMTPSSGVGAGSFQVSLTPAQLPSGTLTTATVVVTAGGASNSVNVTITRASTAAPFGNFDTPVNNTTGVAGSIAVTGWALDAVGIANLTTDSSGNVVTRSGLQLWRAPVAHEAAANLNPLPGPAHGLVYIGDAVFVDGARPDVEAAKPGVPYNDRAGWGYLLLTNELPNSDGSAGTGNGTYQLHAIVTDLVGRSVDLGTRTITCDNAHAAKPFGAIDTPGQGATASGSQYVNYGWALTPLPASIPIDGSSIWVYVDGAAIGHPVYNLQRADIVSIFPGYANTQGAVGYYILNTTALANGLHTIAWSVTDNQGRADGIGSRYFQVLNGGAPSAPAGAQAAVLALAGGVKLRQGYDGKRPWKRLSPGRDGAFAVTMDELSRVELEVGAAAGYRIVNGNRRPLPVGSSLSNGVFRWQLGPGFLGTHELLFEGRERIRIRVTIRPQAQTPPAAK